MNIYIVHVTKIHSNTTHTYVFIVFRVYSISVTCIRVAHYGRELAQMGGNLGGKYNSQYFRNSLLLDGKPPSVYFI